MDTARVWDAVTGMPLTEPMQHGDSVKSANSVIFSPDGTKIVITSNKTNVRVWDATTGIPLTKPMEHGEPLEHRDNDNSGHLSTETLNHGGVVRSVVFSPDSTKILTVSGSLVGSMGTTRVWDTVTGKPLSDPLKHGVRVKTAVFSPDGSKILIISDDKTTATALVWSIAPESIVPVPNWLPPLAEAVAEYRINDQSVLEPVEPAQLLQFRERFRDSKDKGPYSQIARWFFADKATRPASPYNMDANTK